MTNNDALLIMWIAFAAAATLGVSGVLVWAVRSRQFLNQDRARYLPLTSGIPGESRGVSAKESHSAAVGPPLAACRAVDRRRSDNAAWRKRQPHKACADPSPGKASGGEGGGHVQT